MEHKKKRATWKSLDEYKLVQLNHPQKSSEAPQDTSVTWARMGRKGKANRPQSSEVAGVDANVARSQGTSVRSGAPAPCPRQTPQAEW